MVVFNPSSHFPECVCVQMLQSCPTLCDPMDLVYQAPLSIGFFQARILGWVTIPSSRGLPDPGIEPASSVSPALQANSLPLGRRKSPSFLLYISIYQCSSVLPKVIPITCPLQADLEELAMSFCVTLSLLYFFIFIGICFYVWFMAFILFLMYLASRLLSFVCN